MIETLSQPINERFYSLVSSAKSTIKLCAPYVKKEIIQEIYSIKNDSVRVECISNINLPNFYKRSSDIEAFETITSKNDKIYNCQMLHAKLYIFDENSTIITSSNLTTSGFKKNVEYGVYIDDPEIVSKSLVDYGRICNNEKTGVMDSKKISDIKTMLNQLPLYREIDIDLMNAFNEVDDVIKMDEDNKNLIISGLSEWKKTTFSVVDSIATDEFSLENIYEREGIFIDKFPNNNTVRDSIRRNLQELRDLGLIKFLGDGRYKKLWR